MTPKQIKTYRKDAGWTQAQFAQAVGVNKNTVARWERGEITPRGLAARAVSSMLTGPRLGETFTRMHALGHSLRGSAMTGRCNPPTGDPDEALRRLLVASVACGSALVVIGGLAVIAHKVVRFTSDIDMAGLDPADVPCFLAECGGQGFDVRGAAPKSIQGSPFHMVSFFWPPVHDPDEPRGMGVDVFLCDHPFMAKLRERSVGVQHSVGRIEVASPEDLVVMKLEAGRIKDLEDAKAVWGSYEGKFDKAYVSRWAKKLKAEEAWETVRLLFSLGDRGWGKKKAP